MRVYDIIEKKRDGGVLSRDEIKFFIDGYTKGDIPDYQASALMMAVFFRGMTDRETADLTECMASSGDTVDLSAFGDLSADKHSTGGVGDKTSLIVAPIAASLGCKVAKMSGRGLGHTGGTVDKLESIPGYRTSLSPEEFMTQVEKIGMAIIGQSGNLTPADKKLYALRDVTATVDSIPLITSSIMSKKIAAGAKNIVLDVKTGSGAFMKTLEDSEKLARNMVEIGRKCGRNMAALITDMDVPLGYCVGNTLEIIEACDVIKGDSPGALYDICIELAANMVSLTFGISVDEARRMCVDSVRSGKAFEKMKEWVSAQGGDAGYLESPGLFRQSDMRVEVKAECDGYVSRIDAGKVGSVSVILGAGRASKEDTVDLTAGIVMKKTVGDAVKSGEVIAELHTSRKEAVSEACETYSSAVTYSSEKPGKRTLIYETVR